MTERDARYSIGWSMDDRSLYLTDHVEDDHVVTIRFHENWSNETKRRALRALVDAADAIAGDGSCRTITLLSPDPSLPAPPVSAPREDAGRGIEAAQEEQ